MESLERARRVSRRLSRTPLDRFPKKSGKIERKKNLVDLSDTSFFENDTEQVPQAQKDAQRVDEPGVATIGVKQLERVGEAVAAALRGERFSALSSRGALASVQWHYLDSLFLTTTYIGSVAGIVRMQISKECRFWKNMALISEMKPKLRPQM